MWRFEGLLSLFNDDAEHELGERGIVHMIEALASVDVDYLALHPDAPRLSAGKVAATRDDSEVLADVPSAVAAGVASEMSLVAWRVAELRREGVNAAAHLRRVASPAGTFYYDVLVAMPGGELEDPVGQYGLRR